MHGEKNGRITTKLYSKSYSSNRIAWRMDLCRERLDSRASNIYQAIVRVLEMNNYLRFIIDRLFESMQKSKTLEESRMEEKRFAKMEYVGGYSESLEECTECDNRTKCEEQYESNFSGENVKKCTLATPADM